MYRLISLMESSLREKMCTTAIEMIIANVYIALMLQVLFLGIYM